MSKVKLLIATFINRNLKLCVYSAACAKSVWDVISLPACACHALRLWVWTLCNQTNCLPCASRSLYMQLHSRHSIECVYVINSCCTVFCVQLFLISFSFTALRCPGLPLFPNGAIITYGPDMIAPYDVDTVATHTCNEGFVLVAGSETRVCLLAGRWSGLARVCQRT